MPFEIVRNDIVNMNVDEAVCATRAGKSFDAEFSAFAEHEAKKSRKKDKK